MYAYVWIVLTIVTSYIWLEQKPLIVMGDVVFLYDTMHTI